ncbi:MAG: HD-GYP domain-containing protein [Defluviitaleaceae bacterium]|nr:HD-GYP domain-containing protein [Defluviitaleaceae bacterium]
MYTYIIDVKHAQAGMTLAESAYITTASGSSMLAARKGMQLDATMIKMLTTRNVPSIEILSVTEITDIPVVVKNAPTPKRDPNAPPPETRVYVKNSIDNKLKEDAVESIKELFKCDFSSESEKNRTTAFQCVKNIESVVDNLVEVIASDSSGLVHIANLKDFDDYTYHHSLSVAILSIATGRELGLDEATLAKLGRCAMMHDIGKQMVPLEIITKRGILTKDEFETVKNHSVLGAVKLQSLGIGDEEMWNGIMYHHEKVNGKGYPKQLKGDAIPLFSKIVAVADVYDAVTSYRSYRSPMLPTEAFNIIFKDINIAFDGKIVKAFFSKLDLYPVNTIVELSDGRLAIVAESDHSFRLRPTVKVWGSEELIYLAAAANKEIEIVAVMNPSELPAGYDFM